MNLEGLRLGLIPVEQILTIVPGSALISYPTTVVLNSCNYLTSSALTSYPTTGVLNSCNHITASALTPYPTTVVPDSCKYLTSNSASNIFDTISARNTALTYPTTTQMNTALTSDGHIYPVVLLQQRIYLKH